MARKAKTIETPPAPDPQSAVQTRRRPVAAGDTQQPPSGLTGAARSRPMPPVLAAALAGLNDETNPRMQALRARLASDELEMRALEAISQICALLDPNAALRIIGYVQDKTFQRQRQEGATANRALGGGAFASQGTNPA